MKTKTKFEIVREQSIDTDRDLKYKMKHNSNNWKKPRTKNICNELNSFNTDDILIFKLKLIFEDDIWKIGCTSFLRDVTGITFWLSFVLFDSISTMT